MTVQVQFECAFLGTESSKLSATAWSHKLCNTTQDTNHPCQRGYPGIAFHADSFRYWYSSADNKQTLHRSHTRRIQGSQWLQELAEQQHERKSEQRSQKVDIIFSKLKKSKSSFRRYPFTTIQAQYRSSIPVLYFTLTQRESIRLLPRDTSLTLTTFRHFRLSPALWACRKETKYIKERHLLVMT